MTELKVGMFGDLTGQMKIWAESTLYRSDCDNVYAIPRGTMSGDLHSRDLLWDVCIVQ
jgi:hypothetical protein